MPYSLENIAPAKASKVITGVEFLSKGDNNSEEKNLVIDDVFCTHTHTMQKRIQIAGNQIYLTKEQADELIYRLS